MHRIINAKVSFPFSYFHYAIKLSILLESLQISIYWVKIFKFFLCVLTWNRPSATQKFKLRYSFIRVVSSHGNLLWRNFYFHLAFTCSNQNSQIQNPIKRLRFALWKYLTSFSYKLLSFFSKLLYTETYPEPSQTSKMELFAKILNGLSR